MGSDSQSAGMPADAIFCLNCWLLFSGEQFGSVNGLFPYIYRFCTTPKNVYFELIVKGITGSIETDYISLSDAWKWQFG